MQGFHQRGEFDPPEWANNLKNYYWFIRIEGRDKAKRRRYYRKIEKEKLYLAENGVEQDAIRAVCRYLSTLSKTSGIKMKEELNKPIFQLQLIY